MSFGHFWSHRLTVRTSGFHPGNRSSILRGITRTKMSVTQVTLIFVLKIIGRLQRFLFFIPHDQWVIARFGTFIATASFLIQNNCSLHSASRKFSQRLNCLLLARSPQHFISSSYLFCHISISNNYTKQAIAQYKSIFIVYMK